MKITVIGTGYVGLIQAVGLAHFGFVVECLDVDADKIAKLQQGVSPIFEPGLVAILAEEIANRRVSFTTDKQQALGSAEVAFVAVGTPSKEDGSAELKYIDAVVEDIIANGQKGLVVVIKSTVPLGTNKKIQQRFEAASKDFRVVSNPEFLREGTAIEDFLAPDRVVIGAFEPTSAEKVAELYRPLERPILLTDPASAELIKYAANAFLALEISYINNIALLAEKVGADVTAISRGMRLDKRIGEAAFLHAGTGYGGSCFPKDVKELIHISHQLDVPAPLVEAAESINQTMRTHIIDKVRSKLGPLKGKKIALWGLAFKANTDDTRESASLDIIRLLQADGARVIAFDPIVKELATLSIKLSSSALEACQGADALVLATNWAEFGSIEPTEIAQALSGKLIIDGRNFFDRNKFEKAGLMVLGIGR